MQEVFTLHVIAPELRDPAMRAIKVWEKALAGRVKINIVEAGASIYHPDITLGWGQTDRSSSPDRIAEAQRYTDRNSGDGTQQFRWHLILDTRTTWKITWGQRWLWGQGKEDALAAIIHEIGHALGFPHSTRNSDVMAATCGSTVIDNYEAAGLRAFWDKHDD